MATGKLLILALCALACSSQANSMRLTKEISPAQIAESVTSQQLFFDAIDALRSADIRSELVKLVLGTPEQALSNLAELLDRKPNPNVDEVLENFNTGLGFQLLVIKDGFVVIDGAELYNLLSRNAVSLSRTLYPTDYFQQILANSLFQKKIQDMNREIQSVINTRKIPVELFNSVLSSDVQAISRRDLSSIQQRDLISDVLATVQVTLCDSIISTLYGQLNATLLSYQNFLGNISISSSDNALVSVVATFVTMAVDLAKEVLVSINSLASSLSNRICSDIFPPGSNSTTRGIDDGALSPLGRAVATRDLLSDIWSLIWNLISSVVNSLLKSLVGDAAAVVRTQVDNFIQNVLVKYVVSLIDSIFPAAGKSV